jgi:hypothetical protein
MILGERVPGHVRVSRISPAAFTILPVKTVFGSACADCEIANSPFVEYHRTALRLDLYTYTKHPYRKFELNKFRIDATEATRAEVHRFTGSNPIIRYINKRENYSLLFMHI